MKKIDRSIKEKEIIDGQTFILRYLEKWNEWHVEIEENGKCVYYSQPLNEDESWDEFWARVDYASLDLQVA